MSGGIAEREGMLINILKMGQRVCNVIFALSLSPFVLKKGEFILQKRNRIVKRKFCETQECIYRNNDHYQGMHSKKILRGFYTTKDMGERYWPLGNRETLGKWTFCYMNGSR